MKIILRPPAQDAKGNSYFLTQHESRGHQVTNSLRAIDSIANLDYAKSLSWWNAHYIGDFIMATVLFCFW